MSESPQSASGVQSPATRNVRSIRPTTAAEPEASETASVPASTKGRLPYAAPRLTALGDLRGLTFGGSPGVNDSGNVFVQEPPGGL